MSSVANNYVSDSFYGNLTTAIANFRMRLRVNNPTCSHILLLLLDLMTSDVLYIVRVGNFIWFASK